MNDARQTVGSKSVAPLRVLLVEDDKGDALLVREILAEAGNTEVEWAERLGQALERLAARRFDLVLLDLGLPDAKGFEGLARLLQVQPPVPVVVLTGLDDDASALAALENGAQDYLVKGSFDGDLLRRTTRYSVERHHVQQALVEREELYQALVDSIPEIVYSRDLAGAVGFIGAKADAVCGVDRETFYRRDRTWYSFIHPADTAAVVEAIERAARAGDEFKLEYRIVDAHGRRRWFVDHGRGVRDARGNLTRIDGILFDITERKEREERRDLELKESRDALEQLQGMTASPHAETLLAAIRVEEDIATVAADYQRTLEGYIDARQGGRAPDRDRVRALAELLAGKAATPNDVVQLHLRAVQSLSKAGDDERLSALSRLLLLELMGSLAEQYRLAATGRPAASATPHAPGNAGGDQGS